MAAGRDMIARLVLRLEDRLSGGLDRLNAKLRGLGDLGRRIGVLGGALAGLSLIGPIQQAAAFDTQLRDLANTQGLTGATAVAFIGRQALQVERLARQYRILSSDLMKANNLMAANALEDADREALLPILAKVSVAERIAAEDAAKLGVAFIQNFKIPADRAEAAFAKLITAGRLGAVELRDMAAGFPALATAAAGVGMTGETALEQIGAQLEIAKRGAPDAATAMNNLRNVYAKMTGKETVENFAKLGVDWPAVMADARNKSISAFDALISVMRQKVGDDPFKMSQLFADMQVVEGLRPIMQFTKEMLSMREKIALANSQIIDDSLEVRFKGLESQMTLLEEITGQLGRRLGAGFAPVLSLVNQGLIWLVETFDDLNGRYPDLVSGTLAVVGGVIGLAGALGLVAPLLPLLGAGLRTLLLPLRLLTGGAGMLARGLRVLALTLSLLGLPVGAIAALFIAAAVLIGGAALLIWRDWANFAPRFAALWSAVKRTFGGACDFIAGAFTGDMARAKAGLLAIWNGLGDAFGAVWSIVRGVFEGFVTWVDGWTGGAASAAIEGIKRAWGGLTGWFDELQRSWRAPFESFANWVADRMRPVTSIGEKVGRLFGFGGAPQIAPAGAAAAANAPAGNAAASAATAAPRDARIGGEVVVRAEPGTSVTGVQSANPRVPLRTDRGNVLGRN